MKNSNLAQRNELGGHSPVWARRAQMEGCKVYVAAQSTPVIDSQMSLND